MTTPIDLELVELRCRLRGWPVSYRYPAEGPATCLVLRQGGRLVWVRPGGATLRNGKSIDWPEVTAPRWTLERLISEPPEGWRAVSGAPYFPKEKLLEWGGSPHAPEMSMRILTKPKIDMDGVRWARPCTLARLAERHKAAAELALILAEVSDV